MLNVTKVNQQIRKSRTLFWKKTANYDTVANGYWMIKADLTEPKYRKILGLLVERFGVIPQLNEFLVCEKDFKTKEFKTTENMDNKKFDHFLEVPKKKIEDTNLTEGRMRIFKGDKYTYIDTNFMDMLNQDSVEEYFGVGNLYPVYAVTEYEFLMMLPIRWFEHNKHLKVEEPTADQSK